ncbi:hypothetical protein GOP47_0021461 [Adiantum capillus-veneris]|uniref:Cyclin N-terminal domain-containing protein n=1 Tax=Adiantum capillus-veneris TaxID=13818 RepID=A0A9D4U7E5_ADICA|nr:hypothetical protein GOP47_0021461 [Adiantum capillus-veneris]
MAGANEQVCRLRTREALGPSVVRSAPAPVCGNAGASNGANKHPKAPAKRAATEDNQRMVSTVPAQQAKRRAALANLTNQSHPSGSRGNGVFKARVTVSKSKVPTNANSSKHAEMAQKASAADEPQTTTASSGHVESFSVIAPVQHDAHVTVEITPSQAQDMIASAELLVDDVAELPLHIAEADPIAALEQETMHSLYISSDPLDQQGSLSSNEEITLKKQACPIKSSMDIDSNHRDPQLCSSYAKDIYQYLRISELKRRAVADYMDSVQHDINSSMRGILVDWLVEVAEEYKLVPDTLYLTVSYIDRFLSTKVVNRQRLQLLGVACMLVAAKYEEICAPQVEEFCYITDNTYCKEEVLDMERQVLNQLHFELTGPTTKTFLRRFLRATAQPPSKSSGLHMECLGNYLAELTLLEYDFLKYLPSMVAASAVFVAKFTFEPHIHPWDSIMQHHSGYKASELRECVQAIHGLQHNVGGCTLPAIREKYRQHKLKCVASFSSPPVIPSDYFEDIDFERVPAAEVQLAPSLDPVPRL